jgi:hypothetical protein
MTTSATIAGCLLAHTELLQVLSQGCHRLILGCTAGTRCKLPGGAYRDGGSTQRQQHSLQVISSPAAQLGLLGAVSHSHPCPCLRSFAVTGTASSVYTQRRLDVSAAQQSACCSTSAAAAVLLTSSCSAPAPLPLPLSCLQLEYAERREFPQFNANEQLQEALETGDILIFNRTVWDGRVSTRLLSASPAPPAGPLLSAPLITPSVSVSISLSAASTCC